VVADGRTGAILINPSTLTITAQLLSLIAELDEFKGAWRALGRLAPDRLSSLRRVATIESIGSSTRIEGAKLTDREVKFTVTFSSTRRRISVTGANTRR
jgi:hypothetical protein